MIFKSAYMSVIRLVPDSLKEEAINIGIILETKDKEYLKWNFDIEKIKVIKRYFYPNLNLEIMDSIIKDLENKFLHFKQIGNIRDIPNMYNGLIRFTEFTGLLSNNLDEELEKLMILYVRSEKYY